jgi:GTPase SAR1 family protein
MRQSKSGSNPPIAKLKQKTCVLVGDLHSQKNGVFLKLNPATQNLPQPPIIFEEFSRIDKSKGIQLNFQNMHGNEENEPIRKMYYENGNMFLVCFSIVNESSFKNAREIWIPEIRKYNKKPIIFLIGTQCDQRSENDSQTISYEDAQTAVVEEKLFAYAECSVELGDGFKSLLNDLFRAADYETIDKESDRKSLKGIIQNLRNSFDKRSNH